MRLTYVPVLDFELFAGRPVDLGDAKIIGHRYLPTPKGATGFEQYFVAKVYGDSLIEERIASGDWVMFKAAHFADIGQLIVVATPHGLTVKFYFPYPDGTVKLLPANRKHKPQIWQANEINIRGVVVASGRDWEYE